MKPTPVDEMFPEGVSPYMDEDQGPSGALMVDVNREGIHADFNNDFGIDFFDDEDLA
jgi:hypothetical protein